ncbi:PKD domain-containing protein [Brachybacterium massiliense]|uniref:PKD domain-containing protein n=1 Tax=Brachybacterium massiliense TaxID=1755098 RepID=UPI001FE71EC6|nr:hypothetical protein [Brachybacterium massiliense]
MSTKKNIGKYRLSSTTLATLAAILLIAFPSAAIAGKSYSGEYNGDGLGVGADDPHRKPSPPKERPEDPSKHRDTSPATYYTSRIVPVGTASNCTETASGTTNCVTDENSCGSTTNYQVGNDVVVDPTAQSTWESEDDMVLVQTILVDTEAETETPQGYRCVSRSEVGEMTEEPVTITVTLSDFKSMPVQPLQANAGPAEGWLPVHMTNVLHTNPETQELNTELLDTPVAIRATPVSFHWDLGDGNTITTTNPGEPYPSEQVSATYSHEGWYDITLTTTFSGQFSVAGGEWQDIDGTIEITSDPVPIYSKSLESNLVNTDSPVDEHGDPWKPERTPETEGPKDPDARHRTI